MTKIAELIIKFLLRKEDDIMAEVYATLIINEEKEFKNLSARMKAKVKPILISLGFEELTKEE